MFLLLFFDFGMSNNCVDERFEGKNLISFLELRELGIFKLHRNIIYYTL